jgi:type 1 fimbria pilin
VIAAISIAPALVSIEAPGDAVTTIDFVVQHTEPAEVLLINGEQERTVARLSGYGTSTVSLNFQLVRTTEALLCAMQNGLPARSCARLRVRLK